MEQPFQPNNGYPSQSDQPQFQSQSQSAYHAAVQPNPPAKNTPALLALIFGIISILFICCFGSGALFGIPAIILGATSKKNNTKGLVGFILGIVGTVLSLIIGMIMIGNVLFNSDSNDDTYNYSNEYNSSYEYNDWVEDNSSDSDTNSSAYDTQVVGSDFVGYTCVPDGWIGFHETGGTGFDYSVQQCNPSNMTEIVSLLAMSPSSSGTGLTAELAATNLVQISQADSTIDPNSILLEERTYNGMNGYFIQSYYPGDGIYLSIFVFDDTNGAVHYLSVETYATGEYADLYNTVFSNYTFDAKAAKAAADSE